MATNESQKINVFMEKNLVALPFRTGLECLNSDGQHRSILNVATSCANMVMINRVTPEKRLLIFVLL